MNDNFGRRWRPARRRARMAAAVMAVACAALLTGCAGGSSSAKAAGSAQYTKALAYAQCMRSHGVPSFPDPDTQGHLPTLQVGRNGVSQQAVQSAQNACRNLNPGGSQGSAQQQQATLTQALNFSKCMRAHGVPDFPDPVASDGGTGYSLGGIDTSAPQYQSAQQACRSLQSGKDQSPAGGSS
jgi:hypothetical protein